MTIACPDRRPLVFQTADVAGANMAGGRSRTFMSFTCPECQAFYQLVKVEAGSETIFHDVACRACGVSLPGREGNLILKYFLLRHGGRRRLRRRS
jgi:hypothetical protein